MPTGDQRDLQFPGRNHAQNAAIAGAGDVDDVGRKLSHGFDGGAAVAQKLEVEEHVGVEAQ